MDRQFIRIKLYNNEIVKVRVRANCKRYIHIVCQAQTSLVLLGLVLVNVLVLFI